MVPPGNEQCRTDGDDEIRYPKRHVEARDEVAAAQPEQHLKHKHHGCEAERAFPVAASMTIIAARQQNCSRILTAAMSSKISPTILLNFLADGVLPRYPSCAAAWSSRR